MKYWDLKSSQTKFTHNVGVNRNTVFCPFHIVYGLIPHSPIDQLLLPSATSGDKYVVDLINDLQQFHVARRDRLESSIDNYKTVVDVW